MGNAAGQPAGVETLTEDELLTRARSAMARAAELAPGSLGRAIQWAVYDTYAGELGRRALRYVAANPEREP